MVSKISLSILLLLAACGGSGHDAKPDNEEGKLRSLISMQDCGSSARQPGLKLLVTQQEISQVVAMTANVSAGLGSTPAQDELILQINMGYQSSGGYALKLIENELIVDSGWVNIKVEWITPAKGMMTTQALTNPCLFIAIPKQKYKGIRILDQAGKVRLQTSL